MLDSFDVINLVTTLDNGSDLYRWYGCVAREFSSLSSIEALLIKKWGESMNLSFS